MADGGGLTGVMFIAVFRIIGIIGIVALAVVVSRLVNGLWSK
jgi:hypothetical protein